MKILLIDFVELKFLSKKVYDSEICLHLRRLFLNRLYDGKFA
jgi:hypothetical protein